jgi:DNA-binding YbaB/EbfC family protein
LFVAKSYARARRVCAKRLAFFPRVELVFSQKYDGNSHTLEKFPHNCVFSFFFSFFFHFSSLFLRSFFVLFCSSRGVLRFKTRKRRTPCVKFSEFLLFLRIFFSYFSLIFLFLTLSRIAMNFPNFGNLNIGAMMEQMKKMQADVARAQEEIARKVISAESGAGMVAVQMNGAFELISVKIDPALLKPEEAQMAQDLIIAAVNKAIDNVRELNEEELKKVGGLLPNIPGLDFLK